eukprot:scaffold33273_cov62-Phaeocystis_antarctica.AAC.7
MVHGSAVAVTLLCCCAGVDGGSAAAPGDAPRAESPKCSGADADLAPGSCFRAPLRGAAAGSAASAGCSPAEALPSPLCSAWLACCPLRPLASGACQRACWWAHDCGKSDGLSLEISASKSPSGAASSVSGASFGLSELAWSSACPARGAAIRAPRSASALQGRPPQL